jgi:hypothetical protein
MRTIQQPLSAVLILICAIGGSAFAQANSGNGAVKQEVSRTLWVYYGGSNDSMWALRVDEIRLLKNGNYSYVDMGYYPEYNKIYRVNGIYSVRQIEVDCSDKRSALRTVVDYDLDGNILGSPSDYDKPLTFTFTDTNARVGLEVACRIYQSGVTKDDVGFKDLTEALASFKQYMPPK